MSPDLTPCPPEDIQLIYSAAKQIKTTSRFHKLSFLRTHTCLLMKRQKVHDFTQLKQGQDYMFETIDATHSCMTGRGRQMRRGDYILLQPRSEVEWYQVAAIDHYTNPANLWLALLLRVRNPT